MNSVVGFRLVSVGAMRTWLSGRASPCQGEGRGFESRRPLGVARGFGDRVPWWSGREARQRTANPCTRVQIPSPPRRGLGAVPNPSRGRLAQWLARFPDTEEVTGSIPVSPTTSIEVGSSTFLSAGSHLKRLKSRQSVLGFAAPAPCYPEPLLRSHSKPTCPGGGIGRRASLRC